MKTILLCVTIAALGAACQRVDRTPPASDAHAMGDTSATPAPAAAPTPNAPEGKK